MRRKNRSSIIFVLIFAVILGVAGFIFSSEEFEKNAPKIIINDEIYWNLKTPIKIDFEDDTGVKFIRISLSDGTNEIPVFSEVLQTAQKLKSVEITMPKTSFFASKKSEYTMNIEVIDKSKWNFFSGNQAQKNVKVFLDTSRPEIYVLSNSYSISRGGSAAVVFRAGDNALKDVYVQVKGGQKFYPFKFIKEGFYGAIIAWDATAPDFSADIVAKDYAGNEAKEHIRYFHGTKKYRTSYIQLKDRFIDGKIADLAAQYAKDAESMNRLEKMKFVNETLRSENEAEIHAVSKNVDDKLETGFNLVPFYPLQNGKKVADYADHRFYTYGDNKEVVSESWHMGIDLASTAAAPIVSSNAGIVVLAAENGIYGQNIVINHGYGIYSLYGHCSSMLVKDAESVAAGERIGSTGTSGLALGDHLHFGILVQGVEVMPQEWMDKKWINDNIISVLNAAKKVISQ